MRNFLESDRSATQKPLDEVSNNFESLRKLDNLISSALGLETCLKPEVSIILELFEAERCDQRLRVSMLGVLDGIAQSTMLRYLDLLEQKGAATRSSHETDSRVSYVRISPAARLALDEAFLNAVPLTFGSNRAAM